MSANNNRSKKLLKTIMKANAGCGCGKPKLSDVFEPKPKPKPKPSLIRPHSQTLDPPPRVADKCNSSSSNDGVSITTDQYDRTTTTTELSSSSTPRPAKAKRINDSCIAVVKESDDPFRDFKQSMKQMIVEKEIYDKPDLEELLAYFLELNTASHRHVIVRAFADIWNDVVSERLVVVGAASTTATATASTTTT